jgi:nucleotide-binding universal stress UspA family protein
MFKHLLVPLDGSRLAERALSAACQLAEAMGSRVTLLHIVERDAPHEIHGEKHLTAADDARKYLQETAARRFPDHTRIDRVVESGESSGVARRIQEYASVSGADLIVMCTHGRSGLRHLFAGSNAQQVIASGRIPVLQVRPQGGGERVFSLRRLLVPLDGKAEHEPGMEASALLARTFKSELHILIVVPTRQTLRGDSAVAAKISPRAAAALLDLSLKEAEDYLRHRIEILREEGLPVAGSIERGDAAEAILRVAERGGVDLIILATHRKVGADAFWSGSVAARVTNRSHVPVLLIPVNDSGTPTE